MKKYGLGILTGNLLSLLSVAVLLTLTGCSTGKNAVALHPKPAAAQLGVAEALAAAQATYEPWTDVYLPVTFTVIGEKDSESVSGRATMRHGESILMSFRRMGVEGAVVFITNDSIFAVDKVNKRFAQGPISELFGDIDFTIADVQNMLLGRAEGAVAQSVTISATEPPVVLSMRFSDENGDSFSVQYDTPMLTPAGVAAELASLRVIDGNRLYRGTVRWNLKSAKWNTNRLARFRKPRGFESVTFEEFF